MRGTPSAYDASCRHCGAPLRPNAPFCGSCGQAVSHRAQQPHASRLTAPTLAAASPVVGQILGAGRGLRCACYLVDLAVMLSPALPLAIAAAVLGVSEIVYIVLPVAFVAVWVWMQIWQGYTGMTFAKSMLGLRMVRVMDHRPPGLAACVVRSGVFGGTVGLAALPVVLDEVPHSGLHDRLAGVVIIDVVRGSDPQGRKQDPVLRRSIERGLNKVASPLPVDMPGRR